MNRPKTSDLKSLKSTYYYLVAPKRPPNNFPPAMSESFHLINTKFTRKKYKEDHSLDSNTESAYNTRNGVLNPAPTLQRKPGGNGYFNILRQKRQVAEVQAMETDLDRRVREAKLCRIGEHCMLSNSFAELCSNTFVTTGNKGDSHSRVSKCSEGSFPGKKATKTEEARKDLPAFFETEAVRCICDSTKLCTCGKRTLGSKGERIRGTRAGIRGKIEGILTNCDVVRREGEGCREVMKEQMEEVKKVMQMFARHTKVIMRNIQRSKSYDLRKKFQAATRVSPTQYHDITLPQPLEIPYDLEAAVETDPSLFPPLAL